MQQNDFSLALVHLQAAQNLQADLKTSKAIIELYLRTGQLPHDPTRLLYVQQAIDQSDVKLAQELIKQLSIADKDSAYTVAIAELAYNLAYQQQKLTQAEELLDTWLSAHPSDLAAINLQSQVLKNLGKTDKLLELLLSAEKQSNSAVISHKLAHLIAKTSLKDALLHAKQAVELAPQNPAYSDTYGWLLHQNKQHDKALEYLRISQSSDGQNPYLPYHLSATLVALKRNNEAMEILHKLLKQPIPEEIKLEVENLYNSL